MLPPDARMKDAESYRRTVRGGNRASHGVLVVHLRRAAAGDRPESTLVGLVVGRRVGGAVERNRVKRRLRHVLRERLATVPPGSSVVVRALPGAAARPTTDLERDLDRCLARLGRVR